LCLKIFRPGDDLGYDRHLKIIHAELGDVALLQIDSRARGSVVNGIFAGLLGRSELERGASIHPSYPLLP
jgi:hypothetical protein